MKITNPSSFEKTRKFLFCFLLTIMYCWITPAMSQIKKADPKTPLPPPVSNEVFQTIAQFYEYDRNLPLEAKIVNKEKYQDTNKEKIVFNGANNNPVPSYLIIPNNNNEKIHPVILLADGLFGSKDRWLPDDGWQLGGLVIKALLEKGFAVMACDAAYHGERSYENGFAPPSYKYPNLLRQMFIQTVIDYRRAIDYLYTRTEIDTTRIGMLGLSMGGSITFTLSSFDPRIKSSIAGLSPSPSASAPFATHVRTNSFLMFMGNKDTYWYSMEEARQVFDMIPIKNKEFVEYNTGHEPPKEYVSMTADWFVKNLKP